jgi:RNA polymerase sigma factor (sigma-70 family)
MANNTVIFDNFTESLAGVIEFKKNLYNEEDSIYKKMKIVLKKIINGELTNRQKSCIFLYYGEKAKLKDIAQDLGIGIGTVSRHIKRAKHKIKKNMSYYFSI